MTEMEERVAKAIALSHEGRNWETMMEHGREWWRKSACAAIEAMREPTEEMVKAGARHDSEYANDEDTADQWKAMIDAALGQKEAKK